MIGVGMNPSSIYVSLIQAGCCNAEFDSAYPIHLNGIISQDEFQNSINRINRIMASNTGPIILHILCVASIICGSILLIADFNLVTNSNRSIFDLLIGLAFGVIGLGAIIFSIGCYILRCRLLTRIRQAIAEESMKYSLRLPIPCSWRWERTGNINRRNDDLAICIVIDIGRPIVPENEIRYTNISVNESKVFLEQSNNNAVPPYSVPYLQNFVLNIV